MSFTAILLGGTKSSEVVGQAARGCALGQFFGLGQVRCLFFRRCAAFLSDLGNILNRMFSLCAGVPQVLQTHGICSLGSLGRKGVTNFRAGFARKCLNCKGCLWAKVH